MCEHKSKRKSSAFRNNEILDSIKNNPSSSQENIDLYSSQHINKSQSEYRKEKFNRDPFASSFSLKNSQKSLINALSNGQISNVNDNRHQEPMRNMRNMRYQKGNLKSHSLECDEELDSEDPVFTYEKQRPIYNSHLSHQKHQQTPCKNNSKSQSNTPKQSRNPIYLSNESDSTADTSQMQYHN